MIELTEGMIGKKLKVICNNGKTYQGECFLYIPAKDNIPEKDSISIIETSRTGNEIYIDEIKSIEIIN